MALSVNESRPYESGSRQATLVTLQVLFVSVAFVFYSLRVYTRAFILRSFAGDDYLMGIALLTSIGLSVNGSLGASYGWGIHISAVLPQNMSGLLLTLWISELLFTFATSFVKLSVLFFCLRLAVTRTYRRIIHASIAFIVVWTLVFSIVIIFQCNPVHGYWSPIQRKCFQPATALFIHGLTNTLTDIYVYLLPIRLVWEINLPRRQRIGLLVILGLGFLTCVTAIVRLFYSIKMQSAVDFTWLGFEVWTWESLEVNLGIICASVPCLKALGARLFPRVMGDSLRSENATHQSAVMRGNQAWSNRVVGADRWSEDSDVETGRGTKMDTVAKIVVGCGSHGSGASSKPVMNRATERSESRDGLKGSVDTWK